MIWNFQKARAGDGCHANGGLALDSEGHLYGTTSEGGAYKPPLGKGGTVFQLTRSGAVWSESVLWSFGGTSDGYAPRAGLTVDAKGNLYGTTSGGGGCCGTVFELEKTSGWTELQLHVFTGRDGARPASPVIFDKDGNLNGTAFNIKDGRGGVTFRMFEASTGWKISVLQVSADSSDLSLAGNLGLASIRSQHYGVRPGNGRQDHGSVFTRSDQRVRTSETVVYSFAGPPRDGEKPNGVIAAGGRLYGTTAEGGEHEVGTVFELTP